MKIGFKLLAIILITCLSYPAFSEDVENEIPFGIQEYAETYNVSYDEAIIRLQRQEEIGELNKILLIEEHENFAGLYVRHEPVYRITVLFKQPHAKGKGKKGKGNWKGKLQKRLAKTSWRSFVKIRKVRSSLKELQISQETLPNLLSQIDERADSSIDVINNLIELSVLDKYSFEEKLSAEGLTLPSNVVLNEVESLTELSSLVYGGEDGFACTWGFAVKDNITGTKGMLTADHCHNDQIYNGSLT